MSRKHCLPWNPEYAIPIEKTSEGKLILRPDPYEFRQWLLREPRVRCYGRLGDPVLNPLAQWLRALGHQRATVSEWGVRFQPGTQLVLLDGWMELYLGELVLQRELRGLLEGRKRWPFVRKDHALAAWRSIEGWITDGYGSSAQQMHRQ